MNTDLKHTLTLCAVVLSTALISLAGLAHGAGESPTLRALRAIPVHTMDIKEEEPQEHRDKRLRVIAEAIDEAANEPLVRAALIVLARRESGLAAYVYENRCEDGPRGEAECDSGKATGPFQLHTNRNHPEIPESIRKQAEIAASLWRFGRKRCRRVVNDELAGAFASYGSGGKCAPSKSSKSRARETRAVAGRLW